MLLFGSMFLRPVWVGFDTCSFDHVLGKSMLFRLRSRHIMAALPELQEENTWLRLLSPHLLWTSVYTFRY